MPNNVKPQVTHRRWSPCVDHVVAYAQSLASLPLKEAFSSHHCGQAIISANTLLAAEIRYVALAEEELLLIAKLTCRAVHLEVIRLCMQLHLLTGSTGMLQLPRFLLDGTLIPIAERRPHYWCSKTMSHGSHGPLCLGRRINLPSLLQIQPPKRSPDLNYGHEQGYAVTSVTLHQMHT
jgi:hypothetical protein